MLLVILLELQFSDTFKIYQSLIHFIMERLDNWLTVIFDSHKNNVVQKIRLQ